MKKPSLIVDIGPLSCCGTDLVLEFMSKALHDDEHDIWRPHESPHIRDLIETWTKNGIDRLGNIRDEFMRRVGVTLRNPPTEPVPKPKLYAGRWNSEEIESVRLYLESLPEEAFALDDWMMMVDYLVQKYLPLDVMMDESKLQVMRASMMGRVQAHMPDMSAKDAIKVAMEFPLSIVALEWEFGMTAAQRAAIEFGQARCCQYVTNVTESVRDQMKHTVLNWQQDKYSGSPSLIAKRDLQGKLLDDFAVLNRDWRRIALTETANSSMNGFLSSLPVGAKVKRQEMYGGACSFCRSIDGRVFTVVAADAQEKNGETEIWTEKDNSGRSASPRKRSPDSGGLVVREANEMYWVPAGPVHPHCRGRWSLVKAAIPADDPRFAAYLDKKYGAELLTKSDSTDSDPTPAQAEAGNYKKRKMSWRGLTISIENEPGSIRRGTKPDGSEWQTKMTHAYGYVNRTLGVDGDHIDVFIGRQLDAPMVYVVHQRKVGRWDEYDEDKCFIGFLTQEAAKDAFLANYDDPRFLGSITAMPVDEFVEKAREANGRMVKALAL